jgi:hypothetical protein
MAGEQKLAIHEIFCAPSGRLASFSIPKPILARWDEGFAYPSKSYILPTQMGNAPLEKAGDKRPR